MLIKFSQNHKNFDHQTQNDVPLSERGYNIKFLIQNAIDKFELNQDFEFLVQTKNTYTGKYSIAVNNKKYDDGFPSHIFYKWNERNIGDFETLCSHFYKSFPITNKIGWIGSLYGKQRVEYYRYSQNKYFLESIFSTPTNYLSFQEQIDKWKYFIDLEGFGFSARVPILLRSPRIVFLVDRVYEEWYYEFLEPWIHYVPVKSDFSDLQKNYEMLEADENLQKFIKDNQKKFADKYLTRDAALEKIAQIINIETRS